MKRFIQENRWAALLLLASSLCIVRMFAYAPAEPRHRATGLAKAESVGKKCVACHAADVAGNEPAGSLEVHGMTISASSDRQGAWQQFVGQGASTRYRIDDVIAPIFFISAPTCPRPTLWPC